jgi:hypothetical protein
MQTNTMLTFPGGSKGPLEKRNTSIQKAELQFLVITKNPAQVMPAPVIQHISSFN